MPYAENNQIFMKHIDAHCHILNEESYQAYKRRAQKFSSEMKCLCMPSQAKPSTKEALEFVQKHDDLFLIGRVIMGQELAPQLEYLEELFKSGKMYGIKLTPGYEYFKVCGEEVYPVARLCQKYNKPLIFHMGDTASYVPTSLLKYIDPIDIDELAVKFPDLKIVISHFAFPYFLETAMVAAKNKNVYTDISGTLEGNPSRELINQYIADLKRVFVYYPNAMEKTMFATDYISEESPICEVAGYADVAKKVFPKSLWDKVFFDTAQKLYFE